MSLTKVTYSMIEGAAINLLDFGFSPANTALANRQAIENAFASGATNIFVDQDGNYDVDNTTPIVIATNNFEFRLSKNVNIKPNTNNVTVFSITGQNVMWDGGSFEGDGTYNGTGSSSGRSVAFIEVYNGPSPTAPQNVIIQNVTMVNPNNTGIQIWRTVGVTIQNCLLTSNYPGPFFIGHDGINVYSSANITIQENTLDGFNEGCAGGGTASYSFTDFTSVATDPSSRNIIFSNNQVNNFIDHGIYFASFAAKTVCSNNSFTSFKADANYPIKLFGYANVITGNVTTCTTGGFSGRAINHSVISNNTFIQVVDGGPVANSALIQLDAYDEESIEMSNISITDNILDANAETDYGIYLYSTNRISDGGQNLMKNIVIQNNVFTGKIGGANSGTPSNQSGIFIFMEKHNTPASSAYSDGLVIADNVLDLSTDCRFGFLICGNGTSSAFQNVSITGNVIKNYKTTGILALIKNSHVANNVFNPTGTTIAITEITDVDTPSGDNYYGRVTVDILNADFVIVSESSWYDARPLRYESNLSADTTLLSTLPYQQLVFNPTASSRAITLVVFAGAVFPIGYSVTIGNISSTQNLTFELSPGGSTSTINPNTNATFVCVGSNTFVKI
jgi:hypothetical protein